MRAERRHDIIQTQKNISCLAKTRQAYHFSEGGNHTDTARSGHVIFGHLFVAKHLPTPRKVGDAAPLGQATTRTDHTTTYDDVQRV